MKYFLQRDGRTYGPYSIDDLRRYQSENRIGPNDLIRRDDSQNWEPWQQVLNAPAAPTPAPSFTPPAPQPAYTPPAAPTPTPTPSSGFGGGGFGNPPSTPPSSDPWGGGAAAGGGFGAAAGGFGQPSQPAPQQPAFGGFGQQPQSPQAGFGGFGQPTPTGGGGFGGGAVGPMPPDMQWYIVLLISIVCGFFALYWIFKQASFVQQIDPASTAKKKYTMGFILYVAGYVFMLAMTAIGAATDSSILAALSMLGMLVVLGGFVFLVLANFEMRKSIHNYYTTVEPMGINLMDTAGALLTFFFAIYFFQYHFANIAARKKAMGHQ